MIDVTGLYFDDENEAKLRMHGVSVDEVQQVLVSGPASMSIVSSAAQHM